MTRVNLSLQLIDRLVKESDMAAFAKDNRGRYIWINEVGAAMLGRTPDEIIGRTDFELFEKSSAQLMLQRETQLIYRGESREYESIARCNGVWKYYRTSKHVYPGPNGVRDHIVGFSLNITHGRDAEKLSLFQRVHECLQLNPRAFASFMSRLCSTERIQPTKIAN